MVFQADVRDATFAGSLGRKVALTLIAVVRDFGSVSFTTPGRRRAA